MSIQDLYFVAEQPIATFASLCSQHEIILSRSLLCRTLAIQILEEWDPAVSLDVHLEELPIPHLLTFVNQHNIMIDVYGLKLKLWLYLYQHRQFLHVNESWFALPKETVDSDTLDDVLSIPCFQDHYEEWMGQPVEACLTLSETVETCQSTTKVDTIFLELPEMPDIEAEETNFSFQDNPELASLVSDVLAAETKPKRSRFLSFFTK
jgi:hypothetical protein